MTKVTIKAPSDYLQTDWSGGETNQLFLYPENGDYGERKFSYRLSTATVPYDRQPLPYLTSITGS